MVKVVIAGAGSEVAREVLDKLVDSGKHEVLVLGRGDVSDKPALPGVTWSQTSYNDHSELVSLLTGFHTVLCFWDPTKDAGAETQKGLVDAAIEAGVKRFAPSEWSSGESLQDCLDVFPYYASKVDMRKYLREINKDKPVIEYTLFQVGVFMEYLGHPTKTNKHLSLMPTLASLTVRRIIGLDGHLDDVMTYTSVSDVAGVVAAAVAYDGPWPEIGGISGDQASLRDIQRIGEKIQGTRYKVDALQMRDVEAGDIKLEDLPPIAHPSVPEKDKPAFARVATCGLLLSATKGAWTVTDEWNKLLPEYKFTTVEEFARRVTGDR